MVIITLINKLSANTKTYVTNVFYFISDSHLSGKMQKHENMCVPVWVYTLEMLNEVRCSANFVGYGIFTATTKSALR